MKKNFSLGLAVLFCVVMSFLALNCETGLGPAVDVEPPRISITYPPANVAIRDAFVLAGTCSDDQGVKTITVNIYKDNAPFAGPYEANVASDGQSWSIKMNEGTANANACPPLVPLKNFPLKDGTYVFRVQATDKAGRKSDEIASSYDIDNTAPVLLVSKPLGVFDEKATSYGRVLRFAGDASDDHNLSLSLYWRQADPANRALIGPLNSIENFSVSSMSTDAPLIVAKYFPNPKTEEEQILTANYVKIYGNVAPLGSNTDKYYYAGIRLSDTAKVYQNPSESSNNSTGNTTDMYFVNSGNLTDVLSKYGTDGVKAGDIKRILNESDTTYGPAIADIVKAALQTSRKEARNFVKCVSPTDVENTSSYFKLNPDNNPTWAIGGYTIGEGNKYADTAKNYFRPYSEGNSLTLDLMPNADKDKVRPYNIRLWIQRYKEDASHNLVKDTSETGRHLIIRNRDDEKKNYIYNPKDPTPKYWDDEQTDENASMQIAIGSEEIEDGVPKRIQLSPNEYWKFELEGEDAA